MSSCPQGHQSQTLDYCDVCGIPIGSELPPAAQGPRLVKACHHCKEDSPADALFCEACGYDFTTGALPFSAQPSSTTAANHSSSSGPASLPADSSSSTVKTDEDQHSIVPHLEDGAEIPVTSGPQDVDINSAADSVAYKPHEDSTQPPTVVPSNDYDPSADTASEGDNNSDASADNDPAIAALPSPNVSHQSEVTEKTSPQIFTSESSDETTISRSTNDAAGKTHVDLSAVNVPPHPAPNPVFELEPAHQKADSGRPPSTLLPDGAAPSPKEPPAHPSPRVEPLHPEWGRWVIELWVDPEWYASQEAAEPIPSPGPPTIIELTKKTTLIGRPSAQRGIYPDIDCDPDVGVSRRQTELFTDGTRWWVRDLGSANGTYVGRVDAPLPDNPVQGRAEVGPDDRIYVGAWTRIVVRPAIDGELD